MHVPPICLSLTTQANIPHAPPPPPPCSRCVPPRILADAGCHVGHHYKLVSCASVQLPYQVNPLYYGLSSVHVYSLVLYRAKTNLRLAAFFRCVLFIGCALFHPSTSQSSPTTASNIILDAALSLMKKRADEHEYTVLPRGLRSMSSSALMFVGLKNCSHACKLH